MSPDTYALEILVLGITGKQYLWKALASAKVPCTCDYAELETRAESQRDLIEAKRLEVAQSVFE